ncbi:hypothetical protein [Streptomyces sp. NBC_00996]|uniref:hypothetical protein n=1 Tax=Streptomyces sp. NBC_00996 TaxID=2903710 RepID=UPI0038640A3C|nr:hypothetical protein OG390_17990 [Streptomyces sp. NBC_00996]
MSGAVKITATGTIAIQRDVTTTFSRWGESSTLVGSDYPLPGAPAGSLIARIGNGPATTSETDPPLHGAGPTILVGSGHGTPCSG